MSSTRYVYVPARVLLDSNAQPLMLGISLEVRRSELEPCIFKIQTSLRGASDRSYFMIKKSVSVQLRHDDARDRSEFRICALVTSQELYDVLVGGAVLYPMSFQMDYWTETSAYRPGWQLEDGRMSELPGARPLGSSPTVLASIAGFSGVLAWPDNLLEGKMLANNTPIYEDVE